MGLPLVLIEAMACGLYTLCNDLPGVREWLRSEIPENATRFVPMPPLIASDRPDPDALEAFKTRGMNLLGSRADTFSLCRAVGELLA